MPEQKIYIKYYALVDEPHIKALLNTIESKRREGINEFVILISCPGGNVFHGLSAYNFLKGLPVKIITHNFGSIISMGLVLFCAGEERYSVPHGTFLLHGVQSHFPKGAVLEEKQLEERLKALQLDTENIAGVVAANTGKSEEEILKAMHERTTLNPEEAQEFGLIQEIKEELFEEGSELIIISAKKEGQPS